MASKKVGPSYLCIAEYDGYSVIGQGTTPQTAWEALQAAVGEDEQEDYPPARCSFYEAAPIEVEHKTITTSTIVLTKRS